MITNRSLPAGTFAIALMFLALPSGFPFQARSSSTFSKSAIKAFPKAWQRLDIIGAGLLLAASLLLVTALLETSFQFSWSSRITILLLVFSACSWILFIAWEWLISSDIRKQEPIFPWHFLFNRAWMGMLL